MRYLTLFSLITLFAFTVNASPLTEGITDDRSPVLVYSGLWSSVSNANAVGGGYQSTTDFTATLSLDTYAQGLTIIFYYDPTGDDVSVCVDAECIEVPTLGASGVGRIELLDLGSALKNITVSKVTDDTSMITFDAVYIHPDQPEEQTGVSENSFTYDGQDYGGVYDLRITSGDAILAVLLTILTTISLFNLIIKIWELVA